MGVAVVLLLLDVLVLAWCLHIIGNTGYSQDRDPETPHGTREAMWFLFASAAITGGGLLALRLWIAGTVQLLVLGAGGVVFALASL